MHRWERKWLTAGPPHRAKADILNLETASLVITLRPVDHADIPQMAAIRAREWKTEAFWIDRIGLYLSGKHSPQQALSARAAFVATEGKEIVGFVAGHRTHRLGCSGELQWINVAEESRGHGIAGRLIAQIAIWFVGQDASRVCVNVDPNNIAARKLYTRYGAEPLNEYWMVWENAHLMAAGRPAMSQRKP